jgi:hypothetical protein
MLIYCSKEQLTKFIQEEIRVWKELHPIQNLNAYEFDPAETDPKVLEQVGYFNNPEGWVAAIRVAKLYKLLEEIENSPPVTKQ